jgi:cysteine desulfurase/selenocysteine lyase
MKFDALGIKNDFPLFTNHPELVYLDSGATYQKPKQVIDAICNFYSTSYASVHRGLYPLSEAVTTYYEQSRATLAHFINAQPEEIVFTRGTTESINLVAAAWARTNLKAGDEIVLSQVEHHANLVPWQQVAKLTGAIIKFIPLNLKTHLLEFDPNLITKKTKLLSVTHSSNVLNDVWAGQLAHAVDCAKQHGAKVLLDGAQAFAHHSVDVKKLNCDFYALSGHKTVAPTGSGALYINSTIAHELSSYQMGGSMVNWVTYEDAEWTKMPHMLEAGTPAVAQNIAMAEATKYLTEKVDFNALVQHEAQLCAQLIKGLQSLAGVTIYGNIEQMKKNGHLVCFSVDGIHGHDVAGYLGSKDIASRAGHHCAQPLAKLLGVDAMVRASFGMYNTNKDVDIFLLRLAEAINFFKKM